MVGPSLRVLRAGQGFPPVPCREAGRCASRRISTAISADGADFCVSCGGGREVPSDGHRQAGALGAMSASNMLTAVSWSAACLFNVAMASAMVVFLFMGFLSFSPLCESSLPVRERPRVRGRWPSPSRSPGSRNASRRIDRGSTRRGRPLAGAGWKRSGARSEAVAAGGALRTRCARPALPRARSMRSMQSDATRRPARYRRIVRGSTEAAAATTRWRQRQDEALSSHLVASCGACCRRSNRLDAHPNHRHGHQEAPQNSCLAACPGGGRLPRSRGAWVTRRSRRRSAPRRMTSARTRRWFAMEGLQATRPAPQKVDAEGNCAEVCGHIVFFKEPIVPMKELEHLDAANPEHRRSPRRPRLQQEITAGGMHQLLAHVRGPLRHGSHRMTRPGAFGETRLGTPASRCPSRACRARSTRRAARWTSRMSSLPLRASHCSLFFEVFAGGSRGRESSAPTHHATERGRHGRVVACARPQDRRPDA